MPCTARLMTCRSLVTECGRFAEQADEPRELRFDERSRPSFLMTDHGAE